MHRAMRSKYTSHRFISVRVIVLGKIILYLSKMADASFQNIFKDHKKEKLLISGPVLVLIAVRRYVRTPNLCSSFR